MKIDVSLTKDLPAVRADARERAAAGFDGLWVGESQHEPFLTSLLVAETVPEVEIGTSIAIAFARTPMTVATAGYDLAHHTGGRFILGLGSQIRPHIERRYSMPWSRPAARMREFVLATRAIWRCWHDGEPLDFRGEFYRHTLMTPNFTPPRIAVDPPPIYLAAVGPKMTEVAGEVADGVLIHPFHTPRYLAEVTLPALERGAARAERSGPPVLAGPAFVATGRDDHELTTALDGVRRRLAFYGSTPAYRPVLDLHGWGDLQPQLNALSKQGRWDEMTAVVPDDLLREFAVVGAPEEAGRALAAKYAGRLDRLTLHLPYPHEPVIGSAVAESLRSASLGSAR